MVINAKILDFASDGIQFDQQVVKSKAVFALPYKPAYVHDIFKNKKDLGNDFIIEPSKYKVNEIKVLNKMFMQQFKKAKNEKKGLVKFDENEYLDLNIVAQSSVSNLKFRPKEGVFLDQTLSSSESQLQAIEHESAKEKPNGISQINKLSKSLNNLQDSDSETAFFLTEIEDLNEKKTNKPQLESKEAPKNKLTFGTLKKLEDVDWDENLINQLSEGTARWIAMKRVTDRNFSFSLRLI